MLYADEQRRLDEMTEQIQKQLNTENANSIERAKVGALLVVSSALWGILDILREIRYDLDALRNRS